jgi:hypothetical protein
MDFKLSIGRLQSATPDGHAQDVYPRKCFPNRSASLGWP